MVYQYRDKKVRYRYLIVYSLILIVTWFFTYMDRLSGDTTKIVALFMAILPGVVLLIIGVARLRERYVITDEGIEFYTRGHHYSIAWEELAAMKLKLRDWIMLEFYAGRKPVVLSIRLSESDHDFDVVRQFYAHILREIEVRGLNANVDKPLINFANSQDGSSGLDRYIKNGRRGMVGIRGWLLYLAVMFGGYIVMGLRQIPPSIIVQNFWSCGTLEEMTGLYRNLLPFITGLYSIAVLVTLLRKKPSFVKCIKGFAYLTIATSSIDLILTAIQFGMEHYAPYVISKLFAVALSIFMLFALKKYLQMSVRIRNVFIDPVPMQSTHQPSDGTNKVRPTAWRSVYGYGGKRRKAVILPTVLIIVLGIGLTLATMHGVEAMIWAGIPVGVILLLCLIRALRSKIVVNQRGIYIKRLTTMRIRWNELSGIKRKEDGLLHVKLYRNTFHLTTWNLTNPTDRDLAAHKDMLKKIVEQVAVKSLPVEIGAGVRALINQDGTMHE